MTTIKIISTSQKNKSHQVIVINNGKSKTHHVPISVYSRFEALILKENNTKK